MSSITLAVVGKLRKTYWRDAEAEYKKRLTRYCDYRVVECKSEVEQTNALRDCFVIALDERGETLSSSEFAEMIRLLRDDGKHIGIAIGGADGFSDEFRAQASKKLAFGKMTVPHQLARVMIAEQVYRAFRIIRGEPYHKK